MATASIQKIAEDVRRAGFAVTGSPSVVIRPIAGTNSWSQHSYGNAIDYFPSDPDELAKAKRGERVAVLEELYQFLAGHDLARVVCYYKRGGCTTDHLDHVHVDAHPKYCGDPNRGGSPCSGAPSSGGSGSGSGSGGSGAPGGSGGLTSGDNPLIPGFIEGPADLARLIGSPELWQRVAWVLGGAVVIVLGVVFIAREFGASLPLPPQAQAVASLVGAAK